MSSVYAVRTAGWDVIVKAESAIDAVDIAVKLAPEKTPLALGTVIQVIDLENETVEGLATYHPTAVILSELGYADVETECGLIVPSTSVS